jgi:transcription elongation factor GreA
MIRSSLFSCLQHGALEIRRKSVHLYPLPGPLRQCAWPGVVFPQMPKPTSPRGLSWWAAEAGETWTKAMDKVPMTAEGHSAMVDEIKHLKSVERPRIIKLIEEARSHGDLSENAEYHSAKEQQGWIEARVAELEDKLSRADVIDITKLSGETVKFGARVTLLDEDTDDQSSYQIVGEFEADVKKGKISVSSPIARAIIGKRKGDSVEVATPGGGKSYEISKVAWK